MKRITLVTTGGTIEMVPGNQGLILSEEDSGLILDSKTIPDEVQITHIALFALPSPYMTPDKMAELAVLLEKLEHDDTCDGVVVTHGTDTLEESAYLADIYLQGLIPVIFTAAMRSASEAGVDGPRNIRGAFLAACNEFHNFGVTVVLNDEIHSAQRVTKTCTSNVSSFASPGYGPLGFIDEDRVIMHRIPLWRTGLPRGPLVLEQKVDLVRIAAGYGAGQIIYAVDSGSAGLVIEAFGRGNVPLDVADAIEYAVSKGLIVLICSRCYKGRVLDVYGYRGGSADLVSRGAILAGDMQGHKLRLLLMACLGRGMRDTEIRNLLNML